MKCSRNGKGTSTVTLASCSAHSKSKRAGMLSRKLAALSASYLSCHPELKVSTPAHTNSQAGMLIWGPGGTPPSQRLAMAAAGLDAFMTAKHPTLTIAPVLLCPSLNPPRCRPNLPPRH